VEAAIADQPQQLGAVILRLDSPRDLGIRCASRQDRPELAQPRDRDEPFEEVLIIRAHAHNRNTGVRLAAVEVR
jgi:hypothetical protein